MLALWAFGHQSQELGSQVTSTNLDVPLGGFAAVGLILAFVVINGIFVAAETALELLRPLHARHVREANESAGDRLQNLLDHRITYVAACTMGSHTMRVCMVLAGLMLAPGVAHLIGNDSIYLSVAIIAIPIALLNIIFELIPKSFAVLHPHRVALLLNRFILISAVLLYLPSKLVSGVANIFTSRFGGKANFTIANQAEEEIKTLMESAEETGEIESDERELLHSVFEFSDTVAREVMTPRVDLDAVPCKTDPAEVVRLVRDTGHTRIPLYEETDDQIVGIIHAKDLLMAMLDSSNVVSLRALMRPALFVPENKNLHELLSEMRASKSQMAIVQDEFGGTAGVVTIEDIVEELVGEIVDEYDFEQPTIVETEGGWIVDGKTHVDDVNAIVGADFESEEFDTIGGFVFGRFGRQPKRGESIEAESHRFTIEDTDGRRILRIRIEPVSRGSDLSEMGSEPQRGFGT